jgi:integrase
VGAPRRQPYRDVGALSADEARRLLAAIPTETVAGLRLHTLATWFLITGRRHAEVLWLRWEDVDLEGGTYTYEGKGGKSERRELVPELVEAVGHGRGWWPRRISRARRWVFPGRWADEPLSLERTSGALLAVFEG